MSRGSKPGERRGGRQKGTPNKVTAPIKELARQYVPEVLPELARLATKAESEAARVAAIKELLDRAYGKAAQAHTGEDGGPIKTDNTIRLEFVDASGDDDASDPEAV
jgi:hypothetical protein